jgi:rSAM/selenodomain-associated transferase 2
VKLSVIIPTLNEARQLPETLRRLAAVRGVDEVIVSDGGSTDSTREIATAAGATMVTGPAGRGCQCRAGAWAAGGDALLFLHADTWPPPDAATEILAALAGDAEGRRRIVAGAFRKRLRDAPWTMRGSTARSRLWFALTGLPFADQGIFIRRDTLESIGGFPDPPLMEEFELIRRTRRLGRVVLLRPVVESSARRFMERGIAATYLRMAEVLVRYALGETPEALSRRYGQARGRPPRP